MPERFILFYPPIPRSFPLIFGNSPQNEFVKIKSAKDRSSKGATAPDEISFTVVWAAAPPISKMGIAGKGCSTGGSSGGFNRESRQIISEKSKTHGPTFLAIFNI